MASPIEDSCSNPGLDRGDVLLAACKPNLAEETPSDLFADAYNAQSKIRANNWDENSGKLFASFLSKVQPASSDPPLINLPAKVQDADASGSRVQPPRQAKPKEGALHEDWLYQHLKTTYPGKEPWRALELFTEDTLYKAFPKAQITAQATEIPGIRPDFVMKHEGRTVVIDSKYCSTSYIRKRSDVDKLLCDMEHYDASRGVLVVCDKSFVSEDVEKYCENNGVTVVEANRLLGNNLRQVIGCAKAKKTPKVPKPQKKDVKAGLKLKEMHGREAVGPLKKDGTPDMRFKENFEKGDSIAEAHGAKKDGKSHTQMKAGYERGELYSETLGPLKKDGTPDLRYKANYEREDSYSEDHGTKKKDGKPDAKMNKNYEREDLYSDTPGPMKKDGTPDLRFKANYEREDSYSEDHGTKKKDGKSDAKMNKNYEREDLYSDTHGPMKKDGTPDLRFKANYEREDSYSEDHGTKKKDGKSDAKMNKNYERDDLYSNMPGPMKKDGTPDLRFKANYEREVSYSEDHGTKKKDGKSGVGMTLNYERGDSISEVLVPLKKDGTPDRRYKDNYEHTPVPPNKADVVPKVSTTVQANTSVGPLKKDGTPDMRYKANSGLSSLGSLTTSRVSSPGFSGSRNYSYNGSFSGPLTKAGLPDMRYSANRY